MIHPTEGRSLRGCSAVPVQTDRPPGPLHNSHPSGPGKRTEPAPDPGAGLFFRESPFLPSPLNFIAGLDLGWIAGN
ncbi:MAG: hypothetical protein RL549_1536 [Verrucomicrobiota bacterium]